MPGGWGEGWFPVLADVDCPLVSATVFGGFDHAVVVVA
jgi:hypothetical protein